MSRSYRKTPVRGNMGAESDKRFKSSEHRRERAKVRALLASGQEPADIRKQFGDPWNSTKDGKGRFDPDRYP